MSTEEITEAGHKSGQPSDETARHKWFTQFGYAGDPGEVVTLRDPATMHFRKESPPEVATATVADVWAVWKGLHALRTDWTGQFHRLGNWAFSGRRPMDPAGRLCEPAYGPLTDARTGEWLPGYREIVLALTCPDPADNERITFVFCGKPLARPGEEMKRAA